MTDIDQHHPLHAGQVSRPASSWRERSEAIVPVGPADEEEERLPGRALRNLAAKLVDRPDRRAVHAQDQVAWVNVRVGSRAAGRHAGDEHALR